MKQRITDYIRASFDPAFNPESDELLELLDSIALVQLIAFISNEFDVSLDMSSLTMESFATVDTVMQVIEAHAKSE